MCYFGEGGFTFNDLYTMPVYLRNFYFNELVKVKNDEQQANQKNEQQKVSRPKYKR